MTREELIKLHEDICTRARIIMESKNRDYAGGLSDPFANFRAAEVLGVDPEIGLLMRCMDKFKRLETFVRTGDLAVKTEPVDDVFLDVINYMVLCHGLVLERRERKGGVNA